MLKTDASGLESVRKRKTLFSEKIPDKGSKMQVDAINCIKYDYLPVGVVKTEGV